jgi:hypothetical protein
MVSTLQQLDVSQYTNSYNHWMGNLTSRSKIANHASKVLLLGLFIIGCIGASGGFPASTMGWTTFSLGTCYVFTKFLGGNLSVRGFDLLSSSLLTAFFMIIGTLGAGGVMTSTQMGFALIGSLIVNTIATTCLMVMARRCVIQRCVASAPIAE